MELEQNSVFLATLFGFLSFVCVMLLMLLLYTTCSRKYKLNWFEKNLLESVDAGNTRKAKKSSSLSSVTENLWTPKSKMSLNQDDCEISNIPEESELAESPVLQAVAGNDSMIVLTTNSPVRPKIASMQSVLDHTKIDSSLYQIETGGEKEEIRGSLHIIITYDGVAEILTAKLVEAQDLQARDFSGTADPYAKIRLLPDKTNVWQTKIHKKTLNPVFDEDFVFEVPGISLHTRTLEIVLYDFDAYSRHHSIGGLRLPLCEIDLLEKVDVWKNLMPVSDQDSPVDLGELMVSFSYLPSAERLTVVVMKARNLRVVDDTRTASDPFVKINLYDGNKKIKKRKTGVRRNTVCPVYNEAFTFNMDKETLKKCSMEFMVFHDSLLSSSELLGKCRVGYSEDKKKEQNVFLETLKTKSAVARWLPLSDS